MRDGSSYAGNVHPFSIQPHADIAGVLFRLELKLRKSIVQFRENRIGEQHKQRKQQVEIIPVVSDVEWLNKLFGLTA
jgi:hypothetical protein